MLDDRTWVEGQSPCQTSLQFLQGRGGLKASNLIQRQFQASKPYKKCYTDVTDFAIPASEQKLYLSSVLDGYNSEIIAYNLSTLPNLTTTYNYA